METIIAGMFFAVGIGIGLAFSRWRKKKASPDKSSVRRAGSPAAGGTAAPSRKQRKRRK